MVKEEVVKREREKKKGIRSFKVPNASTTPNYVRGRGMAGSRSSSLSRQLIKLGGVSSFRGTDMERERYMMKYASTKVRLSHAGFLSEKGKKQQKCWW